MRKNLYLFATTAWLIGALFYGYDFLVRTSTNALANYLIHDLNLSAIDVAFVGSIFFWFYLLAQIPAGILVDRYGVRRVMAASLGLMTVGTVLFAISQQFYLLCCARALMGFAGGFAFVCALKLITVFFSQRLFPLFAGLTQFLGYLGAASSGGPLVLLLNHYHWRFVFLMIAAFGIILLIATFKFTPRHQDIGGKYKLNKDSNILFFSKLFRLLIRPQFLFNGFYCTFMMGATSVFSALWGISYIVNVEHLPRSVAAWASSLVFVGVACASPFWGSIASWLNSNKKPLVFAAILAAINTSILLYYPISVPVLYLTCFLFGAFQSAHVLNFTILQRVTEAKYLGTALALLNMFTVGGGAVLQLVAGLIIEHSVHSVAHVYSAQNYRNGLFIIPLVQVLAFILALLLNEKVSDNG